MLLQSLSRDASGSRHWVLLGQLQGDFFTSLGTGPIWCAPVHVLQNSCDSHKRNSLRQHFKPLWARMGVETSGFGCSVNFGFLCARFTAAHQYVQQYDRLEPLKQLQRDLFPEESPWVTAGTKQNKEFIRTGGCLHHSNGSIKESIHPVILGPMHSFNKSITLD